MELIDFFETSECWKNSDRKFRDTPVHAQSQS